MSGRVFKPLPAGVARPTKEHMPFAGHRNCAQWGHKITDNRAKLPKEMTEEQRAQDAREGSARLRDAIKRAAA